MYLFFFYCVFIFVLFVIPSYTTYKHTGINPIKFGKEETAINYVGKAYKVVSSIAFVVVLINAFWPSLKVYLNPIESFESDYLVWVGYGLLHFSFIIIFIAQRNMANEWRIGIDNENKVKLVTGGLFRISRNPIFLGVIISFVGLFLIIPNAATAIIFFSGLIVIQVQVRLEEEFLQQILGTEYKDYMNKVNRWLL